MIVTPPTSDLRARYCAMEQFWKKLEGIGCSVAGVGSRAWLAVDHLRASTDYDFLIVCENWDATVELIFGKGVQLPQRFDCVAVRKLKHGDSSYGCVIFSSSKFLEMCQLLSGTIRYFRPVDSKVQHLICSVRGNREWVQTPGTGAGGGRISDVPIAILRHDDYFIGPVRESLISCPVILCDHIGILEYGCRLQMTTIASGMNSVGIHSQDVGALLKGLSRADRLSTWAVQLIAKSLREN
jgi:hypothetical protein